MTARRRAPLDHDQVEQPVTSSLEDLGDDVIDDFTPWGRDPFDICCLIEEAQESPLKEPVKKTL